MGIESNGYLANLKIDEFFLKIPQILQIKLMFTVQYYGPGCSRVNSNVFQFSQIGKNVALSKFW